MRNAISVLKKNTVYHSTVHHNMVSESAVKFQTEQYDLMVSLIKCTDVYNHRTLTMTDLALMTNVRFSPFN